MAAHHRATSGADGMGARPLPAEHHIAARTADGFIIARTAGGWSQYRHGRHVTDSYGTAVGRMLDERDVTG